MSKLTISTLILILAVSAQDKKESSGQFRCKGGKTLENYFSPGSETHFMTTVTECKYQCLSHSSSEVEGEHCCGISVKTVSALEPLGGCILVKTNLKEEIPLDEVIPDYK